MGLLEILQANVGKTPEEIESIINKEFLPKNFVSKEQYDKKNGELKSANDQLEATSKEMTELSKTAGLSAELKAQLEAVQKEHNEYKTNVETRDIKEKQTKAIRSALLESGAIDDVLEAKLDLSKIVFDAENSKILDGLAPQIEALKTERPHMFKNVEIVDKTVIPNSNSMANATNYDPKLLARMGLTAEQMEKHNGK